MIFCVTGTIVVDIESNLAAIPIFVLLHAECGSDLRSIPLPCFFFWGGEPSQLEFWPATLVESQEMCSGARKGTITNYEEIASPWAERG